MASVSSHQRAFHITVGTAPTGEVNLDHDLRMVKAALLYADRVKLCSLTSSIILSNLALGELSRKQQIDFLGAVLAKIVDRQQADLLLGGLERYKRTSRKKHLSRDDLLFKLQFETLLKQSWHQIKITSEEMAQRAGADGLIQALNSGIFELHVFR